MFDSLDDSIKHDLEHESSAKARMIRYAVITVIALIVIVALYEAVRLLG
jgi:hypothetical protein